MAGLGNEIPVVPDGYLGYRIVRLAAALQRRFRDDLEPLDLKPREFSILAVLSEVPEVTTADLARAVLVAPQSMAALIDGLHERGLVERSGPRRRGVAAPLALSPAGREAVVAAGPRIAAGERAVFGELSAREQAVLRVVLSKLEAALPD